jgi:hypothetical protein
LWGPLERDYISHWGIRQSTCLQPYLRKETNPVSETLCSLVFLEYRTMDKSKNPVILSTSIQSENERPLRNPQCSSFYQTNWGLVEIIWITKLELFWRDSSSSDGWNYSLPSHWRSIVCSFRMKRPRAVDHFILRMQVN